jgi:hypothetical protein
VLSSKLLSSNARLRDCELNDAAHVKLGDQGDFVGLIQRALMLIDDVSIAASEIGASLYGESTAAAVLKYKTSRNIINRSYQTQADDIVGKLTIKSIDDELLELEGPDEPFTIGAVRPVLSRLV